MPTTDQKPQCSLARAGEYLEAVVMDQGAGFDVSAGRNPSKEGTFGLFNIRERLDLLGGRLEVTSTIDEGTCAKIMVPLKAGPCPNPFTVRTAECSINWESRRFRAGRLEDSGLTGR